jgi:hypothetical protein
MIVHVNISENWSLVRLCKRARLPGASMSKPASLLRESKATVPKDMSAYVHHGKKTSAKKSNQRKSKLTET